MAPTRQILSSTCGFSPPVMNCSTQRGAEKQAPAGTNSLEAQYSESQNAASDCHKVQSLCSTVAAFSHNEPDILLEEDSNKLHVSSILTDDQPALVPELASSQAFTRRQGKTCAECRRQHQQCDFSRQEKLMCALGQSGPVRCSRCMQRNITCVQGASSQHKFCPRPTRTGRRIELGRQLHGSTMYSDDGDDLFEAEQQMHQERFELSWPRIYLRLIHCFLIMHIQWWLCRNMSDSRMHSIVHLAIRILWPGT